MLKLVVFDCDGVMFSSKESNRAFYNHILAHFGHPAMDADELEYAHIHNVKDSITHLFRHYDTPISEVNRFRESLDYTPYLHYMEMEPDLIEFLQTIKPRVHIAISTNRMDTMDIILDTFHIRPWFDMVVTASNAPRPQTCPRRLRDDFESIFRTPRRNYLHWRFGNRSRTLRKCRGRPDRLS